MRAGESVTVDAEQTTEQPIVDFSHVIHTIRYARATTISSPPITHAVYAQSFRVT